MDHLDAVDVVFAGTSMAWQDFVPAAFSASDPFGRSAYNAALAGGVPPVMRRWIVEEVIPRIHPTTVVWGLSSLDFAPGFGDLGTRAYETAPATRRGLLGELERRAARWLAIVERRSLIRSPSQLFGTEARNRRDLYHEADTVLGASGERLGFETNTSAELAAVQRGRLADFSPSSEDLQALRDAITDLTARGIDVVLVELPVPRRFIEAHPQGGYDHGMVGYVISEIASELGIRFLDLSDGFDDSAFSDFTHLSSSAADEFTRRFALEWAQGHDDAGNVPEPLPTTQPNRGSQDCRQEYVLDEYGSEIEIEICGDDDLADPPEAEPTLDSGIKLLPLISTEGLPGGDSPQAEIPGAAVSAELVDWLGSSDARLMSTNIAHRVIELSGCGSASGGLTASLTPSAHVNAALRDLEDAVRTMEQSCGTDDWLGRFEVVVEQVRRLISALGQPTRRIEYATLDTTERTAAAAALMDYLHITLIGRASSPSGVRISLYWANEDVLALARHVRVTRRVTDTSYPQVGIIGTSIAAHSFDQGVIAELADVTVLNAGVHGADVDQWGALAPDIFGDQLPRTVIWAVTTHRLVRGPRGDCATPAPAWERRRQAAFSSLLAVQQVDIVEALLGPTIGRAYDFTPVDRGYSAHNLSPGQRLPSTGAYQGLLEAQVVGYQSAVLCDRYLDVLEETIRAFMEDGASVVLVVIPSHQDIYNLAPELHQQALARLKSIAEATGAPLVTGLPALTDEYTEDGWHPNAAGRQVLSTWLGRWLNSWHSEQG